jgi:hypothetical protein
LFLEESGSEFLCALSQHTQWLQTNQCLTSLDISQNVLVAYAEEGVFPADHTFKGDPMYAPDFRSIVGFFNALQKNK